MSDEHYMSEDEEMIGSSADIDVIDDTAGDLVSDNFDVEDEGEPPTDDSQMKWSAHAKDVFRLCVSNSRRWLASGSEDDTAAIWDLSSVATEPYLRINDHLDSVNCLSFNSASTLLASGDMKGIIVITEVDTKRCRCKIEETGDLEWLLWHNSADILFAGDSEGLVWMWLVSDVGVLQSKVFTSGSASSCVAGKLLSDAKHLLVAHADGQVRIWNLKEATAFASISLSSPCSVVDVHPRSNLAAIGCQDGTTAVINTQNHKVLAVFGTKTHVESEDEALEGKNSVECVCFLDDFPWLAICTSGGALTIYDLDTSAVRHACDHDGMAVVGCEWKIVAPQKDATLPSIYIASACIDGAMRVWDAKTGDPLMLLSGGGDEIYDFCIVDTENGTKLFTACSGGIVRMFSC